MGASGPGRVFPSGDRRRCPGRHRRRRLPALVVMLCGRRFPLLVAGLAAPRHPGRARPVLRPAGVVGTGLGPVRARCTSRPARVIRARVRPAWVRGFRDPVSFHDGGWPARVLGTLGPAWVVRVRGPAVVVGAGLGPVRARGASRPARVVLAGVGPVRRDAISGRACASVIGPASGCLGVFRPPPGGPVAVLRHWCAPALPGCAQRHPDCHRRWPRFKPPVRCDHGASNIGRERTGPGIGLGRGERRASSPGRHSRARGRSGTETNTPRGTGTP